MDNNKKSTSAPIVETKNTNEKVFPYNFPACLLACRLSEATISFSLPHCHTWAEYKILANAASQRPIYMRANVMFTISTCLHFNKSSKRPLSCMTCCTEHAEKYHIWILFLCEWCARVSRHNLPARVYDCMEVRREGFCGKVVLSGGGKVWQIGAKWGHEFFRGKNQANIQSKVGKTILELYWKPK